MERGIWRTDATIPDLFLRPPSDCTVTVFLEPDGDTLATLFESREGSTTKNNPFLATDGVIEFYASIYSAYRIEIEAEGLTRVLRFQSVDYDAGVLEGVANAANAARSGAELALQETITVKGETEAERVLAQQASDVAQQVANFKGAWADATGAATVPASYFNAGSYWALLQDVADITATEPGLGNPDWAIIATPDIGARLFDDATLAADFATGRYKKYTGVATGVENVGFTDIVTLTRGSAATGVGVNAIEEVAVDEPRLERDGLLVERNAGNIFRLDTPVSNSAAEVSSSTVSDPSFEFDVFEITSTGGGLVTAQNTPVVIGEEPDDGDRLWRYAIIKPVAGVEWVAISVRNTLDANVAWVNVQTGVLGSTNFTAQSEGLISVRKVGELVLIAISALWVDGSGPQTRLGFKVVSGDNTLDDAPTPWTLRMSNWHLEIGEQLSSYIDKKSSTVLTRDNDSAIIPINGEISPISGTTYVEFTVLEERKDVAVEIVGNGENSTASHMPFAARGVDAGAGARWQFRPRNELTQILFSEVPYVVGKIYRAALVRDNGLYYFALDGAVSNSTTISSPAPLDELRLASSLILNSANVKFHRLYDDPEPWSQAKAALITGGAS